MKSQCKLVEADAFESNPLHEKLRELWLMFLIIVGVYLTIALFSYDVADPGWTHANNVNLISNQSGLVGAWLADFTFSFLGYLAFLIPVYMFWEAFYTYHSGTTFSGFKTVRAGVRVIALVTGVLSACALLSLYDFNPEKDMPLGAGGLIGLGLLEIGRPIFGVLGATLILSGLLLTAFNLYFNLSWFRLIDSIRYYVMRLTAFSVRQLKLLWQLTGAIITQVFYYSRSFFNGCVHFIRRRYEERVYKKELNDKLCQSPFPASVPASRHSGIAGSQNKLDFILTDYDREIHAPDGMLLVPDPLAVSGMSETNVPQFDELYSEQSLSDEQSFMDGLPEEELLDQPVQSADQGYSKEDIKSMSELLEAKLQDFGVIAQVVAVKPGPVITLFEIQPAPGVKVSKITNLAKDLARSMAVISVRIVEVIPGKSVVGVEIPNHYRAVVFFRELITSDVYKEANHPLSLALGHDIGGSPVVTNLASMPHLLVAGTTGSGKSVGVNAMILSLLYRATPDQVRMLMIDPKMLELSVYEGIPHLLTPVITDMKEAAGALNWCVAEMERRYQLMAALGVRNFEGFNNKIAVASDIGEPVYNPLQQEGPGEPLDPFPYIVVVIDEFADMMMIVGKKVEESIARIAQKARAAGIHLILATQRPSVDVITGLIKANIPSRISFLVSSKIDSRTILDQGGAEQLLGHGDMLFLPPGAPVPIRVHGAFVSDDEVHRVVADWKQKGSPRYVAGLPETGDSMNNDRNAVAEDSELDALYDDAVAFVIESGRVSVSAVQRKLKIGYNRAARMVEAMEAAGLVSAMENNGSRDVLIPPQKAEI